MAEQSWKMVGRERKMEWSYGVTTVPDRLGTLLPRTLESLKLAGFDNPRIFIDGCCEREVPEHLAKYALTCRSPKVRTFGSWMLAAMELVFRQPNADRYALFQDDMVTYLNLREYLEGCTFPEQGYWNLYTFPQNEKPIKGWYESNQLGKGAVALVFSNKGMRTLLAQQYMIDRVLSPTRGWKALDGGIVSAYKKINWKEFVHNPSLVQHTGEQSVMGNSRHALANTFKGEDFDATELLGPKPVPVERDPLLRRIGLVGHNCDSPLGHRNWELATNTDVTAWLVKPDGHMPISKRHPNVDTVFCPKGSVEKLKQFLDMVDVVVFCNNPCYNAVLPFAKGLRKRVIAVMDTTTTSESWTPFVDLFLCTTLESYNALRTSFPCVEFSWPSAWGTGANKEFNLLARTGEHRITVV
jgi:hypothetical protein